jgi:hypothetical protein
MKEFGSGSVKKFFRVAGPLAARSGEQARRLHFKLTRYQDFRASSTRDATCSVVSTIYDLREMVSRRKR